ncbi:DUF1269 domain-containing protein [Lactococcus sp. S64]|uniref:DUF1269 domain-containing protein n=1 Tax=Lactococcus sp. S64 TaxID=2767459 RepID=UPI001903E386|nr:DUF1269 domain-containing protein [Lactococcus sp. S64]MBK0084300.1 DUF1269 domain-containing protein [Lactococcus sp. S64]
MENVVTINFKSKEKTYEVLSELKSNNLSFNIITAGIIEKQNGSIIAKDGFDYETPNKNWAMGGLLGSLLGVIGGPLGMLFGGSLGMIIGDITDDEELSNKVDTVREITDNLELNGTVLILLIQEDNVSLLDHYLFKNDASHVSRESLSSVQQKVIIAEKALELSETEAKKRIKEQKKEEFREKTNEKVKKLKDRFSHNKK